MGLPLDKNALDGLQADLRALSAEARKKFPNVKDVWRPLVYPIKDLWSLAYMRD